MHIFATDFENNSLNDKLSSAVKDNPMVDNGENSKAETSEQKPDEQKEPGLVDDEVENKNDCIKYGTDS